MKNRALLWMRNRLFSSAKENFLQQRFGAQEAGSKSLDPAAADELCCPAVVSLRQPATGKGSGTSR